MRNLRSCHILVVDDLADNLFLMQTILEAEGYSVDTADSGYAALAKMKAFPPNLILLDVMMPGMNGFEVTQRIRQNVFSSIPILLITAQREVTVKQGLAVGANGCIHKPIDFEELLNTVRVFC